MIYSRNTLLNYFMPSEKLIQTANIQLSCTDYVISAGLLWWISLVHRKGLYTAKISASEEKSENRNMESWLEPLMLSCRENIQVFRLHFFSFVVFPCVEASH